MGGKLAEGDLWWGGDWGLEEGRKYVICYGLNRRPLLLCFKANKQSVRKDNDDIGLSRKCNRGSKLSEQMRSQIKIFQTRSNVGACYFRLPVWQKFER